MSRIRTYLCAPLAVVAGALAVASLGGATPADGATALPDGRVYEQVSAAKKNGNEAGVLLNNSVQPPASIGGYAAAAPGGAAVAYGQIGPSGETSSGAEVYAVSRRNPQAGWESGATVPPPVPSSGGGAPSIFGLKPLVFLPSADLSRFLFAAWGAFVKENARTDRENLGLYRTRGSSSEPEWLSEPTLPFSQAKPEPGTSEEEGVSLAGGSADLSTTYFAYFGTLVPEDASRAPLVEPFPWSPTTAYNEGNIVEEGGKRYRSIEAGNEGHPPSASPLSWAKTTESGNFGGGPWGFYEWHDGVPHSAGELPGGKHEYEPYGAVPAVTQIATGTNKPTPFPRFLQNEVSQDGSKAFFISPQDLHAGEAVKPVELYVREQTEAGPKSVLVSRDELKGGEPAPDPTCTKKQFPACALTAVTPVVTQWAGNAYVYASPDGSRAFFESKDKLAQSAAGSEEPPSSLEAEVTEKSAVVKVSSTANILAGMAVTGAKVKAGTTVLKVLSSTEFELSTAIEGAGSAAIKEMLTFPGPWTYEFNVKSEKVTYLPGVVGPIAASSQDGSSFVFKNTGTKKIELWGGGPAPVEIASFSAPAEPEFEGSGAKNGDVFVFNTNAVLAHTPEFKAAGHRQAYRYDVSSKQLWCVSCAPEGVPPSATKALNEGDGFRLGQGREIADEGRRVFFGTATPLVPAAENGVEYLYEWEQAGTGSCRSVEREGGCVYLISSGGSHEPAFYLDNDETGENVFFATRAGLAKGDTDEAYDVYDARVGGGFPEPPPPVECVAGTCRTPGVPPVLSESLTSALGPPENTNRTTTEESGSRGSKEEKNKPPTRAQKLAKALKACARKPKRQRAACVKRAKKLYGAKANTKRNARRRSR